MSSLPITIATWDYDRVRPLIDGRVRVEGCEVNYLPMPVEECFHRAYFHGEFDVAEIGLSPFLIALSRGVAPYVAVPAFVSRTFRHGAVSEVIDEGVTGFIVDPLLFVQSAQQHLPIAAGIGGGSADAAAALRLLAQLNDLPLDDERLREVALETGADVPVCIDPRPQRMRGIGEMAAMRRPVSGLISTPFSRVQASRAARRAAGLMPMVPSSESMKCGTAPACETALAVAMNDRVGTMTSSPYSTPAKNNATCRPTVPFETAMACLAPVMSWMRCSSCGMNAPTDETKVESRHSRTYFFSSSSISGSCRLTGRGSLPSSLFETTERIRSTSSVFKSAIVLFSLVGERER